MSPRKPAPPVAHGHPIQVVARRTGLNADVIRAWEKRYAVVTPVRSPTGRRLYSDADVERLRLLARATLTGRTIGHVAALPNDQLAVLVRAEPVNDEPGHRPRAAAAGEAATTVDAAAATPRGIDHLGACLDAIQRFDGLGLEAALRRATVALSAEAFLDAVVVRLWARVTDRVQQGTLRPSHAHLTQAVLRRVLDRVTETATSPVAAPDLIVATPPGQPQELGALLASAAAAAEGWRVVYLGPGLPAEDIAEAAVHARARAVTVSLGSAPGDRVIPRELRRLRMLLPRDVPIVVEGTAAEAHRGVLEEIGASVLRDVPTLLARLRALREASVESAEGAASTDGARRGRRARPAGAREPIREDRHA